jgi:hypothetical protein
MACREQHRAGRRTSRSVGGADVSDGRGCDDRPGGLSSLQRRLSLAFAVLLLSGCGTPQEPPLVQFMDVSGDPKMQSWAEQWGVDVGGANLRISSIYPLSTDVAFLMGRLEAPTVNASWRSCLLRSEDGGRHWREVLPPVTGSDVLTTTFVGPDHGWALAMWTVEGPGDPLVYRTSDAGRSWSEPTKITKRLFDGTPANLQFTDEKTGRLWIVYAEKLEVDVLLTTDGGATWNLDERLPWNLDNKNRYISAATEAASPDGGYWRVEHLKAPERIVVSRRAASQDEWTVAGTLPAHYAYATGRVLPATPSPEP